jgi:hypothetical protein
MDGIGLDVAYQTAERRRKGNEVSWLRLEDIELFINADQKGKHGYWIPGEFGRGSTRVNTDQKRKERND